MWYAAEWFSLSVVTLCPQKFRTNLGLGCYIFGSSLPYPNNRNYGCSLTGFSIDVLQHLHDGFVFDVAEGNSSKRINLWPIPFVIYVFKK